MKRILLALLALLVLPVHAGAMVADSTSRAQYNCNGVTTGFAFTFNAGGTDELRVIKAVTATGAETELASGSGYSVSCTNGDCSSGGTVTVVDTCASGSTITILRDVDLTQETDYTEGMPALYETFEADLDKQVRINQEQHEVLARAVKMRESSTLTGVTVPDPVANRIIGWNSAATDLATFSTSTVAVPQIDYIGNYSSLSAAVAAIGSNPVSLMINSATVIADGTTVVTPATMTLWFTDGGSIDGVAGGGAETLTINGDIIASPRRIFGGNITVSGYKSAYPEWWYTGSGVWKTAFQTAIQSGTRVILVPHKTYVLTSNGSTTTITGKNNWVLDGQGATLQFDSGVTSGSLLVIDDCDDVKIQNVRFDGNISGGGVGARQTMVISNDTASCNRVSITGCYFFNTTTGASIYDASGVRAVGANDLFISNNKVDNTDVAFLIRESNRVIITGNSVGSGGTSESVSLWGSATVTQNTKVTISNNVFEKHLLAAFVDSCTITNNVLTNLTVGGGAVGDYAFIANNVVISNNTFTKRVKIGSRNGALTGVTANSIILSGNEWFLNDTYAVQGDYSYYGVSIKNNRVRLAGNTTVGITMQGTGDKISIDGNTLDENGFTIAEFIETGASITNLEILKNVFLGSTSGDCIWVKTASANMGTVYIKDNIIPLKRIRCSDGAPPKTVTGNITSLTFPTVASAAALTLYNQNQDNDHYYLVTGTTNVTSITAGRQGQLVVLGFDNALTVVDGGNLALAGNFSTTANDTLTLLWNGTNWLEVSRSVN